MTRPTDAVRTAVRRCLQTARVSADGPALALVACSGGPDSLALAAGAAEAARQVGWAMGAVVVDHGLQPGSAQAAHAAISACRALGLDPALSRLVSVTAAGSGPEAAARDARYRAVAAAALERGAVAVLLGHTLDDQAETVLLGLARGSGGRSLSGMAEATPLAGAPGVQLLRPLLGVPRTTTAQACRDWGLSPWQDPHNDDRSFTRVRVRHEVMPALVDALGPGVPAALARTAHLLRQDEAVLSSLAVEAAEELHAEAAPGGALSCSLLSRRPAAIRRRILRDAVLRAGVPPSALTAVHLFALDDLVIGAPPSATVRLPGGVGAMVRCGRLELSQRQE